MRYSFRILKPLLFIFFIASCKKDKLEGESAKLIGKWRWIETIKLPIYPNTNYVLYTPQSENKTFSLEFTRTGKIYTYEDDKKDNECYRIVFDLIQLDSQNKTLFGIRLNNKKNKYIGITYDDQIVDTIIVMGFLPFNKEDLNVENEFKNYFIREN